MSKSTETSTTNNDKDNTVPLLKITNGFFLNDEVDFGEAIQENHELISKLVEVKNFIGFVEKVFSMNDIQYLAIEVGEKHEMKHVIEVDLFNTKFKGIIVKYDAGIVKEKEKYVDNLKGSKFIDVSRAYHFRTVNNETEEKKYVKIKKSSPPMHVLCIQRVQINGVKCMEIKKSIQHDDSEKHYVKIIDIKVIIDNPSSIQFHNRVIIKPDSILKYEITPHPSLKLNDLVRFKDSSEKSYQGHVLWIGKFNDDTPAVIVSLNKSQCIDSLKPYELDISKMQTHFQINESGICVETFNITPVIDVISYKTCKESKLEVVDPKFRYPYQKESFKEKILVFKMDEVLNVVTLKWKGLIYNQICMGCELSYESEEGTDGTYGNEKLFDCAPKKGVLITAEKINDQKITILCEYNGHKDLQLISTKLGFEIYDKTSICCIEKLDGIDLGRENLKIGCKIMHLNKFIGICRFIGKVNGKPCVGIELNLDSINKKPIIFDFINFFTLKKGILGFVDLETVDIGTFYRTDSSTEISNDSNGSITNTRIIYYPGNDRTKQTNGLFGEVKWYGMHENGKRVYGIDLESDVDENISNYFLENLFTYEPKHGVIDDDYKIEYIAHAETESSFSVQPSGNYSTVNYEKIINCFLKDKPMEAIDELIIHFPTEFIVYVTKNNETMKPEILSQIIDSLLINKKIQLIIDILKSIESINGIFSLLGSLLSKCIEHKELDFISDVLSRLTTFQIEDDTNNQVCLRLAIKCLENMKEENNPEYQKLKKIYESFIGLCGNLSCFIVDEDIKETFITKMMLSSIISKNMLIDEMKSGKFDINQLNSKKKSPMELAIDNCWENILTALFDLDCNIDKLKLIYNELIHNLPINKTPEKCEIIKLIHEHLEKKTPTTSSMSCNKEREDSN